MVKLQEFKFIDRGFNDSLVLIPGWATDYRIFSSLDLSYNYLLPAEVHPFDFTKALLTQLGKMPAEKISLFGWSLGGFLAVEFGSKYPQLIGRIILAGVREKYRPAEILRMQDFLKKNKRNCLCRFYRQCFSRPEKWSWFKENLLDSYVDSFSSNYLLEGLDYLKNSQITVTALQKIKQLKIIHAEADKIAPLKEVLPIKENLPQAEFILVKAAGHAVFLEEDLSPRI